MRDLVTAATRANVSIYPVDARGLPGTPAPTVKPIPTRHVSLKAQVRHHILQCGLNFAPLPAFFPGDYSYDCPFRFSPGYRCIKRIRVSFFESYELMRTRPQRRILLTLNLFITVVTLRLYLRARNLLACANKLKLQFFFEKITPLTDHLK
jgi:hypothetical protein